jgi:hypothetical protein
VDLIYIVREDSLPSAYKAKTIFSSSSTDNSHLLTSITSNLNGCQERTDEKRLEGIESVVSRPIRIYSGLVHLAIEMSGLKFQVGPS